MDELPETPIGSGGFGSSRIVNANVYDESFLQTPIPQASSTVDRHGAKSRLSMLKELKDASLKINKLNNEQVLAYATDQRQVASKKLEILRALTDKDRMSSLKNDQSYTAISEKGSTSSLGILDVDSLEDFPDETKFIHQMLERSASLSDTSSSYPESKDRSRNTSHSSQMSVAEAKEEQCVLIAAEMVALKERTLALEVLQQMDDMDRTSSVPLYLLRPNDETMESFHSRAAIPNSVLGTSSFDVSKATSFSGNNPFLSAFHEEDSQESFSAEQFIPADSTQAAARLLADNVESKQANEISPLTTHSILPDMSQIAEDRAEITLSTTSLGGVKQGRVSVDEFFRMRSEDTGSLDPNAKCTRPSFGTKIASPVHWLISPDKTSKQTQSMVNLKSNKPSSMARKSLNLKHVHDSECTVQSLNDSDGENVNPITEPAMRLSLVPSNKTCRSDHILQENNHVLQEHMLKTVQSQTSKSDSIISQASVILTEMSGTLLSSNDSAAILDSGTDQVEPSDTFTEQHDAVDHQTADISSGYIFIDDEVPTTCSDTLALSDGFTSRDVENLIYIETESGNDKSLDFGLLPESCSPQMYVTLCNQSNCELQLLVIVKRENTFCPFSIVTNSSSNESNLSSQQPSVLGLSIRPKGKHRMLITCCTPTLQELNLKESVKISNLAASFCVFLDTPQRNHHLLLKKMTLQAQVGLSGLSFETSATPLLTLKCYLGKAVSHPFLLKNTGVTPLALSIEIHAPDGADVDERVFSVSPKKLLVMPGVETSTMLRFSPLNAEPIFMDLLITITIEPNGQEYSSEILCITTLGRKDLSFSRNSNDGSNKGSDSIVSKASSEGSGDGSLNIKSTHSTLSWICTPLGKSIVKTFTIKNFSEHSAKFYAVICDNSNCFKLKNEQGDIVNNRKLVLSSNEGCKISVIFNPSKTGAFIGSIKFASSTATSNSSQQVSLYGYGGNGQLSVEGIPKDGFGRMWLNMGVRSSSRAPMQARFRAHNAGNLPVFVQFKIIPRGLQFGPTSESVFAVAPPQVVLAPGKSETIRVIYQPQSGHENWTASNVTELARLHIITGNEPTRLRLRKILERFPNVRQPLQDPSGINIKELIGKIAREESDSSIEPFRDREGEAQALCRSFILQEVAVIVERPMNESHHDTRSMSCLDNSTRMFVTLGGEIEEKMHETMNDSSSWSVVPPEIKFILPTNVVETILVLNSSPKEQTFFVEVTGEGLEVRPSSGTVPENGDVALQVFCTAGVRAGLPPGRITILMENTKKEVKVLMEINKKPVARPSGSTRKVDHQSLKTQRHPSFASTPYRSMPNSRLNVNDIHGLNGSASCGSSISSIAELSPGMSRELKTGVKTLISIEDETLLKTKLTNASCVANRYSVLQTKSTDGNIASSLQTEKSPADIARIGNKHEESHLALKGVAEVALLSNTDNAAAQSTSTQTMSVQKPGGSDRNVRIVGQLQERPTNLGPCRNQEAICGVFSENYDISFPPTKVNSWSSFKITLKNTSSKSYVVQIKDIKPPFYSMQSSYEIRGKYFLRFKVFFKPEAIGEYTQYVIMEPEDGTPLKFLFSGLVNE